MKIRLRLLLALILFASFTPVYQGHGYELICNNPPERVYLLRHTERKDNSPDSQLSSEGLERAESLIKAIGSAPIQTIYTTLLKRTIETATPLATYKNIPIQQVSRHDINGLMARICNEGAETTVVVIGHSGTIPIILSNFQLDPDYPEFGELYILDFEDQGINLSKGWFGKKITNY